MTNIVLLIWDAARSDHTFVLDYKRDTTPFLKQLGKESFIFPQAITQSFWSIPSIASIFTGKYPGQHGMTMQTADESRSCPNSNKMLTEGLKELGFSTWAFVDDDWINERTGFTRGFDFFKEYPCPNGRGRAIEVLKDIQEMFQPEQPFFLFINLLDSHNPYIVPKQFQIWAKERDLELNVNKYFALNLPWEKDDWQQISDRYDESLLWSDHITGELWQWLQRQGYLDDTIFIVLGDHGEYLGEHGLYHHTCAFYDEILRVLLMIWSSERTQHIIDEQFEMRKLYDLILYSAQGLPLAPETSKYALSECPVPRNIMGAFRRYTPDYQNPHLFSAKRALRTKEWKYIHNSHVDDEFYNLVKDPCELTNIFDAELPEVKEAVEVLSTIY